MAHDIFISYSTKDKKTADAICHVLEQNNLKCWIAPRNITSGKNYAEEIMDGLRSAKLIVLVFSKNSQQSPFVNNEIDTAFSYNKPIISFKIDESMPEDKMEFFLKTKHWLEAYPEPEKVFGTLVKDASKFCNEEVNNKIIITNMDSEEVNKIPQRKISIISMILAFTPLYPVSMLYMGYKVKKIKWIVAGLIYLVPSLLLLSVGFSYEVSNKSDFLFQLYIVFWFLTIIHTLLIRKEFNARLNVSNMMSKDDELYESLVQEYSNI